MKKLIGFDEDLIRRVEDWRRKQVLIPTFSDAVRALLGAGLDVEARREAAAKVLRDAETVAKGMSRGGDDQAS